MKFDIAHVSAFPNVLSDCIQADGCQGGTIHQYIPRLTVGGPAKGIRYGMRPIVQVYLDGRPLNRSWANMEASDLSYYENVQ